MRSVNLLGDCIGCGAEDYRPSSLRPYGVRGLGVDAKPINTAMILIGLVVAGGIWATIALSKKA